MGKKRDPREFVRGPAPRARGSRFYNPKPDAESVHPHILRAAMAQVSPGQFFAVLRKDQDYEVRRKPILGEGLGPDWLTTDFLLTLPFDYSREGDARSHADSLNDQLNKLGKIVEPNPNLWDQSQGRRE